MQKKEPTKFVVSDGMQGNELSVLSVESKVVGNCGGIPKSENY